MLGRRARLCRGRAAGVVCAARWAVVVGGADGLAFGGLAFGLAFAGLRCWRRRRRPAGPVRASKVAGSSVGRSGLGIATVGVVLILGVGIRGGDGCREDTGWRRMDVGKAVKPGGVDGVGGVSSLSSIGIMVGPVGTGEGGSNVTLRGDSGAGVAVEHGTGASVTLRDGAGAFGTRLVSSSVRICRVATWLSVSGSSGDPCDGFFRAERMSWIPARIRSLEDARGMVTLVGNQAKVSQMRSCRVSQIHTV